MSKLSQTIETLWREKKALLTAEDGELFQASYSQPAGFFDIQIATAEETVGFISLKSEGDIYAIVNDTARNFHPGFINTPGHGFEVKTKFRKRGIGAALLSLGIGIVRRDFEMSGKPGEFKVVAGDITGLGLGCYQNFGFKIMEGLQVSTGYFVDQDRIPEINILRSKVSRFQRLKKRLRW